MGRKHIDTREQTVGTEGVVVLPSTGPAKLDVRETEVASANVMGSDKLAILAFMEEPVTIEVATSTDPLAEPVVEVWNDGRAQRFIRGQQITVKRKFVEVLARAKSDAFTNQSYQDGDGNQNFRYPKRTSLKYPFRVIEDANPRGAAWLTNLLAETK